VTSTLGTRRCFFSSLAGNRLAALRVALGLHEDVEDVPVLVDGPPQVLPHAIDLHEDLVGMPLVPAAGRRRRSPSA
jgi:hypothetical protein